MVAPEVAKLRRTLLKLKKDPAKDTAALCATAKALIQRIGQRALASPTLIQKWSLQVQAYCGPPTASSSQSSKASLQPHSRLTPNPHPHPTHAAKPVKAAAKRASAPEPRLRNPKRTTATSPSAIAALDKMNSKKSKTRAQDIPESSRVPGLPARALRAKPNALKSKSRSRAAKAAAQIADARAIEELTAAMEQLKPFQERTPTAQTEVQPALTKVHAPPQLSARERRLEKGHKAAEEQMKLQERARRDKEAAAELHRQKTHEIVKASQAKRAKMIEKQSSIVAAARKAAAKMPTRSRAAAPTPAAASSKTSIPNPTATEAPPMQNAIKATKKPAKAKGTKARSARKRAEALEADAQAAAQAAWPARPHLSLHEQWLVKVRRGLERKDFLQKHADKQKESVRTRKRAAKREGEPTEARRTKSRTIPDAEVPKIKGVNEVRRWTDILRDFVKKAPAQLHNPKASAYREALHTLPKELQTPQAYKEFSKAIAIVAPQGMGRELTQRALILQNAAAYALRNGPVGWAVALAQTLFPLVSKIGMVPIIPVSQYIAQNAFTLTERARATYAHRSDQFKDSALAVAAIAPVLAGATAWHLGRGAGELHSMAVALLRKVDDAIANNTFTKITLEEVRAELQGVWEAMPDKDEATKQLMSTVWQAQACIAPALDLLADGTEVAVTAGRAVVPSRGSLASTIKSLKDRALQGLQKKPRAASSQSVPSLQAQSASVRSTTPLPEAMPMPLPVAVSSMQSPWELPQPQRVQPPKPFSPITLREQPKSRLRPILTAKFKQNDPPINFDHIRFAEYPRPQNRIPAPAPSRHRAPSWPTLSDLAQIWKQEEERWAAYAQRENERKGKATLAELNARLDRLKEGDTPEEIRLKELQKTKYRPTQQTNPIDPVLRQAERAYERDERDRRDMAKIRHYTEFGGTLDLSEPLPEVPDAGIRDLLRLRRELDWAEQTANPALKVPPMAVGQGVMGPATRSAKMERSRRGQSNAGRL